MPYIQKEIIEEVKQIDLLTYLTNYEPDELVKSSRNDYTTRSHTSLHISNGLWTWWAKSISGRSALDYLIKVKDISFMDAVVYLKSCIDKKPCNIINQSGIKSNSERKFNLPKRNPNCRIMINYLCKERLLDKLLVEHCIENHLIYERNSDHAVVFLGYDERNNVRFGCTRSTIGNEKRDIYGSDKAFSFRIVSKDTNSPTLHIFESAIDLLSQITLMKMSQQEWKYDDFISIDGASCLGKDKDAIPIALANHLERNTNIKTLILHLDNDQVGHDTSTKIKALLSEEYMIIDKNPRHAKDVNQVLKNKHKSKTKEGYRER